MIERRWREPDLSTEAIAATVHVSADYLGRIFQKHLGRSILDELYRRRLTEIDAALADSTVSVYAAAVDSGFRSTKHLTRWYKRLRGSTPTQERMRRRHDPDVGK